MIFICNSEWTKAPSRITAFANKESHSLSLEIAMVPHRSDLLEYA